MNIEEERKAFESQECVKALLKFTGFSIESNQYYIQKNGLSQSGIEWLNGGWQMWQAATKRAEEKLEGCVVVPKDQIETWWQDTEEPENFATQLNDLHFIADHIEDGDIMEINEHHTVHLQSSTKFGAWVCQSGQRKFIVGTKDDVEAAVKENMAMLEAQELFEEAARSGNE